MSKKKPPKKIVQTKKTPTEQKKGTAPAPSRRRATTEGSARAELLFGRQNYILMGAGAALIALGLLLMSGGDMPSPDVWEPDVIYSARRTFIAPLVILIGLVVEIFAIFKK